MYLSADANKALVQESDAAAGTKLYYVMPEMNKAFAPSGSTPVVSDATFRKLGRIITDHIGDSENIFMLDAAVGSHRLGEVNVRVITNSANVNLYLKHMLPRQGSSDNVVNFPYQLTVYIAPDLQVSESESLGLKSEQFAISNLERGILFIGGTSSNAAIRDAITSAVTSRLLQDPVPSLGLNASVVNKKGKSVLVFDPANHLGQLQITEIKKPAAPAAESKGKKTAAAAAAPKKEETLYTASLLDGVVGLNGAIWNPYGVFRMFQGITHTNEKVPRQRADIVEHIKAEKSKSIVHITQPLKDLPNVSDVPSALVFLIADSNAVLPGVSKLSAAQASKFFSTGYTGAKDLSPFFQAHSVVSQPGQLDKVFQDLAGSTPVFLVNTSRKDGSSLSAQEIDTIVSAASDGSLASAKTSKDSVFKYDTISSIKGVSSSLDITKGWEASAYSTQASKLASVLSA